MCKGFDEEQNGLAALYKTFYLTATGFFRYCVYVRCCMEKSQRAADWCEAVFFRR